MRIFFFRILFLCPEFNTETSRCNNYANRPKICRDFLCQDAGGSYESREKIEIIKSISEENFFHDIESTLVAIRRIIELDF